MSLQDYEAIAFPLREDLYDKLSAYADTTNLSLEQVFDSLFCDLPPVRRPEPIRDTTPIRVRVVRAEPVATKHISVPEDAVIEIGTATHVYCKCCNGRCRHTFQWRGSARCGCPKIDGKWQDLSGPVATGNS